MLPPPKVVYLRPLVVLILAAWCITRAYFLVVFWHAEGVGHLNTWLKDKYVERLR